MAAGPEIHEKHEPLSECLQELDGSVEGSATPVTAPMVLPEGYALSATETPEGFFAGESASMDCVASVAARANALRTITAITFLTAMPPCRCPRRLQRKFLERSRCTV